METARKNTPFEPRNDPSGDSGARFSLVVLPDNPGSPKTVETIAEASAVSEYDVRQRCLSGRPAVLLRSHDRAALEAKRGALAALGHAAVVIGDDDVREARYPLAVRAVRLSSGGVDFLDSGGDPIGSLSRANDLLLVIANLGQKGTAPTTKISLGAMTLSALNDDAEHRLSHLIAPPLDDIVMDLLWDGGERLRIRSGRFNFLSLGDGASQSVTLNVKRLLESLLGQAAKPLLDIGAATLVPPHPGILTPQLVDGREYDRPDDEKERTHEIYCRTIVAAWRGGLFGKETRGDLPKGQRFFVTRAAAPEVANVTTNIVVTTTTFGTAPMPSGSTSLKTPILVGSAPTAPPPGAFDKLRRWGPPELILPGALAFATGVFLSGRYRGGPTLAAFSAGFLALVHGLSLFSRRRRIENVPTSRARSVAAGLCEVKGTAEAITPLLTPFSQMPCVYYEYTIVPRKGPETVTFEGKVTVSLSSGGASVSASAGSTRSGNSGHIPFRVKDATGAVEVDPRGAVVDVSSEQTLYNPPFDGGLIPPGVPVTVHEKYIPVGYPIYVMGELKPSADGPLRIAAPGNGDVFHISEKSEKAIVKAMAVRANVALWLGVALVAAGCLFLIKALGGWE